MIVMRKIEEIFSSFCFWSLVCFNVLNVCLSGFHMYAYDGGIYDPKSYYEIKNLQEAQETFLQNMFESWVFGILFLFPPVWCYFRTKRINLNAILMQLLPLLFIIGRMLFEPIGN